MFKKAHPLPTDISPSLPVPVATELPATLAVDLENAAGLARAEKATSTRRAYRSDFAIFTLWCADKGVSSLPAMPATVAAFLAHEVGRAVKASTLSRRVASIRYAHKLAGLDTPTDHEMVRATVRGARRTLGTAKVKKAPATADKLMGMALTDAGMIGLRDRALLLLGFAGAFRRSELVALDVADVDETADGLRVTIRTSKTDQEGEGAVIAIPRGAIACPVAALRAWLDAAGITEGALFRPVTKDNRVRNRRLTDKSVANIVKARAKHLGMDPKVFAGHSLRSGFLTSAAARGASIFKMMDQSRHKSVDTLRGYVRDAELFKDHAGNGLL